MGLHITKQVKYIIHTELIGWQHAKYMQPTYRIYVFEICTNNAKHMHLDKIQNAYIINTEQQLSY
jgi:hypothetical protein